MINITAEVDRRTPSEEVQAKAARLVADGAIRHVFGDVYRVRDTYDVWFAAGMGSCPCPSGERGHLCSHLLAVPLFTGWTPRPWNARPAADPFEGLT